MISDDAFAADLRHEEHRQFYAYWRSKGWPGRIPARRDIDPLDFPRLLPRIALIDVLRHDGECGFRYRLTGTEIVERAGRDPTGKRFEDLYKGAYLEQALNTYKAIAEMGVPHLSEQTYPLVEGREFLRYDRLILPLASDGHTVDMLVLLIAAAEYRRSD